MSFEKLFEKKVLNDRCEARRRISVTKVLQQNFRSSWMIKEVIMIFYTEFFISSFSMSEMTSEKKMIQILESKFQYRDKGR